MKVAHQELTLCSLTTVAKGWYLPLSDSHYHCLPGLVSGNRVSRQSTEATFLECTHVLVEAECSIGQNLFSVISRCGSMGNVFAINFENGCRRNSASEYCRALAVSSI